MANTKAQMVKVEKGRFKGGASLDDIDLKKGDVVVVKAFVKRKNAPAVEVAVDEFDSVAMDTITKDKKRILKLRVWTEEI